ncbi:hypothetical protein LTR85_007808 [Meristemomyces frigidus]|nr:hypothetical protein LTR85_007808 [Meristemomyces frigidus]
MSKRKPYTALRQIEHRTQRTVSIRPNAPTARLRLAVNQQCGSRFFQLPPELRMRIYDYIFEPYDDGTRRYRTTAAYYRPGYEAEHRTYTAFLRACRRVWLEASHLPLKLATHTFWFSGGPLDFQRMREAAAAAKEDGDTKKVAHILRTPTEPEMFEQFFGKLTPLNFTYLHHVHFFASKAWLEGFLLDEVLDKSVCYGLFRAKRLTITIRDVDWGFSKKLPAEEVNLWWFDRLLSCPQLGGVEQLCLELEARVERCMWLCSVAARVAKKQSKRFKPSAARHESGWSRPAVDVYSDIVTYSMVKLSWERTTASARMQLHRSGARILDKQLVDYAPLTKRTTRIERKRGGRRSSAVWDRNHRQDIEITKSAKRANAAAESIVEWERAGSLLRFV